MLTTFDGLLGRVITNSLLAPRASVNLVCTNSIVYAPSFKIIIEVMIQGPRRASSLDPQNELNVSEGLFVYINQAVHHHRSQADLYTSIRADQIYYEAVR